MIGLKLHLSLTNTPMGMDECTWMYMDSASRSSRVFGINYPWHMWHGIAEQGQPAWLYKKASHWLNPLPIYRVMSAAAVFNLRSPTKTQVSPVKRFHNAQYNTAGLHPYPYKWLMHTGGHGYGYACVYVCVSSYAPHRGGYIYMHQISKPLFVFCCHWWRTLCCCYLCCRCCWLLVLLNKRTA